MLYTSNAHNYVINSSNDFCKHISVGTEFVMNEKHKSVTKGNFKFYSDSIVGSGDAALSH